MISIEPFCPADVFNPPAYAQGIRVNGAQSILFLSGQVAYDQHGGVCVAGAGHRVGQEVFVPRGVDDHEPAAAIGDIGFGNVSDGAFHRRG